MMSLIFPESSVRSRISLCVTLPNRATWLNLKQDKAGGDQASALRDNTHMDTGQNSGMSQHSKRRNLDPAQAVLKG